MDVRFKSHHLIRCVIGIPSVEGSWVVSFVHALSNRANRREFWKFLTSQAKVNHYLWLCIGDFNQVSSMWENIGGLECSRSQTTGFQQFISKCELMDLEFKRHAYTWSNNQVGEANIRERLDKAYTNVEWRERFPYAQVLHDCFIGLDHCPSIVYCCIPPQTNPTAV